VFNFVGAVASNLIGYIFPCLFYFLLVQYKNKNRGIAFEVARVFTFFFIPFGIFSIVAQYI
jgi:amino acid permease